MRAFVPSILALSMVAAGCSASVRATRPTATVVYAEPPPPRVVNPGPPPFAGAVWAHGHWAHRGGRYVWVEGRWLRPRPGRVWVRGRWERRGRGWVYRQGRWRDRGTVGENPRPDGAPPRRTPRATAATPFPPPLGIHLGRVR